MKFVIYPGVEETRLTVIQQTAQPMIVCNAFTEAEAIAAIRDAEAFFGKITPPILAEAKSLRWVQSATASLEHYIFPALVDHPCVLTNMRGLFSDVIADQVMGYVLCFARNLHLYLRNQMRTHWGPIGGESARVSFATGPGVVNDIDRAHRHLSDETLGIVGFGSIGRETGKRASAFGMRVLAVDPFPTEPLPGMPAVWPIDQLDRLLAESDYVVICAPHTPQTEKLFRLAQFEAMKRDAILINIGRGAIVDLSDLVTALERQLIAGAALDVFEIEPLPADHPLWAFPNVLVTPHVAGYSPRIAERHLAVLLDNIQRFLRGDPLRNVVDKRMWF